MRALITITIIFSTLSAHAFPKQNGIECTYSTQIYAHQNAEHTYRTWCVDIDGITNMGESKSGMQEAERNLKKQNSALTHCQISLNKGDWLNKTCTVTCDASQTRAISAEGYHTHANIACDAAFIKLFGGVVK